MDVIKRNNMPELFNADDIINKSLVARSKVPVYRYPFDGAEQLGWVNPGQSVGVVYAWLGADPSNNRAGLWWMFAPVSGGGAYYYAPHKEGLYDVSALRQQGIISTQEKTDMEREKERLANQPWYTSMLRTALPWIAVIGLGIAVIKKKL